MNKKNSQIFNNYGICSNEYHLVNLGFCLLDNPGDKTKVVLSFMNPEKKKFLTENYIEDFLNKDSYLKDKAIYIRLYIKRNKISTKILKILRYSIFNNNNNKNFDKKKEIECYENYIEFIKKNISVKSYSQFKLINNVKEMIKNNYLI